MLRLSGCRMNGIASSVRAKACTRLPAAWTSNRNFQQPYELSEIYCGRAYDHCSATRAAGTYMHLPARYIVFWTCLISSVWKESAHMSCWQPSGTSNKQKGVSDPLRTANDLGTSSSVQQPNRSARKSAKSLWIITPHLVMAREHKGTGEWW